MYFLSGHRCGGVEGLEGLLFSSAWKEMGHENKSQFDPHQEYLRVRDVITQHFPGGLVLRLIFFFLHKLYQESTDFHEFIYICISTLTRIFNIYLLYNTLKGQGHDFRIGNSWYGWRGPD